MSTKKIAKLIAAIGQASDATINLLADDADSIHLSNTELLAYFGYMNVKFGVTEYQARNSLHNLNFLSEAAQQHIEEVVAEYEGRPVEKKVVPQPTPVVNELDETEETEAAGDQDVAQDPVASDEEALEESVEAVAEEVVEEVVEETDTTNDETSSDETPAEADEEATEETSSDETDEG